MIDPNHFYRFHVDVCLSRILTNPESTVNGKFPRNHLVGYLMDRIPYQMVPYFFVRRFFCSLNNSRNEHTKFIWEVYRIYLPRETNGFVTKSLTSKIEQWPSTLVKSQPWS